MLLRSWPFLRGEKSLMFWVLGEVLDTLHLLVCELTDGPALPGTGAGRRCFMQTQRREAVNRHQCHAWERGRLYELFQH